MKMRWNLDTLYSSFDSDSYIKDLAKLDGRIKELDVWAEASLVKTESVSEAAEKAERYLAMSMELGILYFKLAAYAELVFSVDAKNNTAKNYTEILQQRLPEIAKASILFSRWLSLLDDLESVISSSVFLKTHSFYLKEKEKESKYLLSNSEEILIAKLKSTGSSAWSQLWNVLTSTIKVDIELNGEKKLLPLPVVRNMAHQADGEIRKKAYLAEMAVYEKFDAPAAASLNGVKGEVITLSSMRGYKSPLDMTLKKSRMDKETLDSMFTAIGEYLPVFRKYFLKKAELLGHSRGLPFYDLFAPMRKKTKRKDQPENSLIFDYDQAREFIVRNFRDFSDEMADFADNAFEANWIDAEQREGKRGGAFCENLHVIGESRIMSNFDGSFTGLTTLAHELGHGYHGHCLKKESFLNSDYPMPLAETASIFCETLIVNAALKTAGENEAFTILENSIQGDAQVIVDIYSRFLFESQVFENRQRSSLSVDELKNIMLDAQDKSYGNGLDPGFRHPYMWACKPHYYDSNYNFYNFPYAFGLLFARGLYAEYVKTGGSFIEKYNILLKETTKNNIADVAAMMNIDVRSPAFWRSSLEVTAEDIEKFISLAG